ncbi:hypothetical protein [Thermogemmatispora sp.]|uniref:hypothetical protein n=1 Tax=Thermogemmatispora sp. TaxID=1968838 RepID=UPI002ACC181B|nr:hypothetical protein [Thermogemmatispora sp.]
MLEIGGQLQAVLPEKAQQVGDAGHGLGAAFHKAGEEDDIEVGIAHRENLILLLV